MVDMQVLDTCAEMRVGSSPISHKCCNPSTNKDTESVGSCVEIADR